MAINLQIEQLRQLVHDAFAKHLYESAVFYADKLVCLGGHSAADVYTLAQAFYMNHQYRRALLVLKNADLVEQDPRCRYLAARCLSESRNWEDCLSILGGWDDDDVFAKFNAQASDLDSQSQDISLQAAILFLRGKAYDALENQQRAVRWYKAALIADPFCYEAFKALIENHMLTSIDEYKLIQSLTFRPEHQWLQLLYRAKCKKYDQQSTMEATLEKLEAPLEGDFGSPMDVSMQDASRPPETPSQILEYQLANAGLDSVSGVKTRSMAAKSNSSPVTPLPAKAISQQGAAGWRDRGAAASPSGCGLAENLDVLVCRADWLHYLGAYQECFQLTSSIIERDPYALEAMPLHLVASLELKKKNELFLRAHRLVEEHPDRVVSWFAVACYYMCTRQFEVARRYFGKATTMDSSFAPAWIGFGHSFAFQDESDQAMAAYRTAARLLPGLHLPLLGMGMEYQRMNNLALAEQIFKQGHAICPADPLLCNELGVLAFRNGNYAEAEQWFKKGLDRLPDTLTTAWEPTLSNLGHTYRKMQQWQQAEESYLKALSLVPGQASTFVALGYTYHLKGQLSQAILYYHKGLGIRPEDAFAKEMLTIAIREEGEQGFLDL